MMIYNYTIIYTPKPVSVIYILLSLKISYKDTAKLQFLFKETSKIRYKFYSN